MEGALFISYSHVDRRWMNTFRVHLEGALRNQSIGVWTDRNIEPGTTWSAVLERALTGTRAALVLVSPEYLVSDWCRRELRELTERKRSGGVDAIYWALLRPCAWDMTELQHLQALQEPATRALESLDNGPERDQSVVDLCTRVGLDLMRRMSSEDPMRAMVRKLLEAANRHVRYRPTEQVGKETSAFSVVFRGLDENNNDVVIKVLTNTPLHRLRELFEQVAEARKRLTHPAFVQVLDVFTVDEGSDARVVMVSALAPDTTLANLIGTVPMPLDRVRDLLHYLALALHELHGLGAVKHELPYKHLLGPLIPENIYWHERQQRPLLSPLGVTAFLWQFFDAGAFEQVVQPKVGHYVAPEKLRGAAVDYAADQYFLGMLALQLLEGRLLFGDCTHRDARKPAAELEASSHPWKRHGQLLTLMRRLLDDAPASRYRDMEEVAENLAALEDEHRAIAKDAYTRLLRPPECRFSEAFYDAFFDLDKRAKDIFADKLPDDAHHQKLMDSLVAVLNYRRGNEPSALEQFLPRHRPLGIRMEQLLNFRKAFLATLEARCAGDPQAGAIRSSWEQLLDPVLDEMAAGLGLATPQAPWAQAAQAAQDP